MNADGPLRIVVAEKGVIVRQMGAILDGVAAFGLSSTAGTATDAVTLPPVDT